MTQAILTASNIIQDAIIGFMDLVKTLRKKSTTTCQATSNIQRII